MEIYYKPSKKHIIPDTLNPLISANTNLLSRDPEYSELNVLFMYITTLDYIHPNLIKAIIDGYKVNES